MTHVTTYLLLLLTTFTSCDNQAEPERHLIPKGFTGPVIIIYNQNDGMPEKYEGEFRLYEIPKSGVLRTQFKHPKGFIALGKLQYYYDEANGRQRLIYVGRTAGAIDDGKPQVFSKEISEGTVRYLVGYLSEGDQYFNKLREKIDELFPSEVQ